MLKQFVLGTYIRTLQKGNITFYNYTKFPFINYNTLKDDFTKTISIIKPNHYMCAFQNGVIYELSTKSIVIDDN